MKTEGWHRLQLCNIRAKFCENGSLGSETERDGQEHKHRHMHKCMHIHTHTLKSYVISLFSFTATGTLVKGQGSPELI